MHRWSTGHWGLVSGSGAHQEESAKWVSCFARLPPSSGGRLAGLAGHAGHVIIIGDSSGESSGQNQLKVRDSWPAGRDELIFFQYAVIAVMTKGNAIGHCKKIISQARKESKPNISIFDFLN